jgi:hypothetical protein
MSHDGRRIYYVFIIRSFGNDENVFRHGSDGNPVPNVYRSGFHIR